MNVIQQILLCEIIKCSLLKKIGRIVNENRSHSPEKL